MCQRPSTSHLVGPSLGDRRHGRVVSQRRHLVSAAIVVDRAQTFVDKHAIGHDCWLWNDNLLHTDKNLCYKHTCLNIFFRLVRQHSAATVAVRRSVATRANVSPAPPLHARGPSRLESLGSSAACVWGAAPVEDEFVHFKRHRTPLVDGYREKIVYLL